MDRGKVQGNNVAKTRTWEQTDPVALGDKC